MDAHRCSLSCGSTVRAGPFVPLSRVRRPRTGLIDPSILSRTPSGVRRRQSRCCRRRHRCALATHRLSSTTRIVMRLVCDQAECDPQSTGPSYRLPRRPRSSDCDQRSGLYGEYADNAVQTRANRYVSDPSSRRPLVYRSKETHQGPQAPPLSNRRRRTRHGRRGRGNHAGVADPGFAGAWTSTEWGEHYILVKTGPARHYRTQRTFESGILRVIPASGKRPRCCCRPGRRRTLRSRLVVDRTRARCAVVHRAGLQRGPVEGIDRGPIRRTERDVHPLRGSRAATKNHGLPWSPNPT